MDISPKTIFLTGGTGYMGSRLVPMLLAQGHKVSALTRASSAQRLPAGCVPVIGDAVNGGYESQVPHGCTFVHLVGVSHPSPAKAAQFKTVDLAALQFTSSSNVWGFEYPCLHHRCSILHFLLVTDWHGLLVNTR